MALASDYPPAAHASGATTDAIRAWVRLLAVQKLGLAEVRAELEGDVTISRFDLLANLYRQDGQTLAALSRSMLVTAGNLTGLVDRAERDGLVARHADPLDRRATRVRLTDRGREVFVEAERKHHRRIEEVFECLTPAEHKTLAKLLGTLRKHLRSGS